MSGFSAEWLALRAPLDLEARNADVEAAFFTALPKDKVRLLDLASGAGATIAAISAKLDRQQDWLLTDNDPALLKLAQERYADFARGSVTCRQVDLATDARRLPFTQVDAVTTSAFLDLVTRDFLEELVACVTGARLPFLASLSYDGRAACTPADSLDDDIREAMNAHQKTDKGFGAALGPNAVTAAEALFAAAGYRVASGQSDWHAGPGMDAFQTQLLAGWLSAAREMGLDQNRLARWHARRIEQIAQGVLSITVGHRDFAAIPT